MNNKNGKNLNLVPSGEVILNPITEEMMDADQTEAGGLGGVDLVDKEEQEDLVKFLNETGAKNSEDLPGVDQIDDEDGPDQDLAFEQIEKPIESNEPAEQDDQSIDPDESSKYGVEPGNILTGDSPQEEHKKAEKEPKDEKAKAKTATKDEKAKAKKEPKDEKAKAKKERIDLGRDLMPEAYNSQAKKMFTQIENWEDVRNAVKTKRLVRAEVTQVNDDDQMITVRFDNIRGIIPYHSAGVDDLGKSLVWLVGRTICFVIESSDEKNDGGFFVANRSKGLEALAAEVRKVMKEGSIRQAVVSRVEAWGVWVEMGGVYGRLAKRDLLHSFVANIAEVLQPGNLIDVKITKITDTGRIQVSLKDALPDPWLRVPYNYKIGSIVSGIITGFIPDLIFIEVEPGINTVAPFPRFPVNVGQRVAAKIRWIDVDKKRMSASIWKAV